MTNGNNIKVSPFTFFRCGLSMLNQKNKCSNLHNRMQRDRFLALFGVTPHVCSMIWNYLIKFLLLPKSAYPYHLLYSLMWMKTYKTESVLSSIARVGEKTFRNWCWDFIYAISLLEEYVVRLIIYNHHLQLSFKSSCGYITLTNDILLHSLDHFIRYCGKIGSSMIMEVHVR